MYVIIYFKLIVQVTIPLHFGSYLITILKYFIVTAENVFDVFGMFLETHIVNFWSFCMVEKGLKYSYCQDLKKFSFVL